MLRSLYAGVSGLTNHQMKMDVLGNNIANINTVGFKGGRINFSASLSQMVSGASKNSGAGFLNPMQIGLGMKTNSIDQIFTQGAFESTGNITDMGIEGDGFFILRSGQKHYYSRAGNFDLNPDGTFVNNRGLLVQGWMLNDENVDPANLNKNNLSDIVLDSNIISEAKATENVWLSGNLNAGLRPVAEVWTSGGTITDKAIVTGSAVTFPLTVVAGTNDQFTIEITGNGATRSEELTLTAGAYADISSLLSEINTQITGNSNLNGVLEAVDGGGGTVKFRSTDSSNSTTITLESGTNDVLADLGFTAGDSGTAGTTSVDTADLNDTMWVTSALASGDTIDLTGVNPDGSSVSGTFTYGVDGTTVQDLITFINTNFTGATATYSDGQIVLTDDVGGESDSTINLASGANTGVINLPGFSNTTEGFIGKASTSVIVYDSMGGSHTLVLEFTKTENNGEWTWEATASDDETITAGGTGRVLFNSVGELTSFTYDGGVQQLTMDPGNGANTLSLSLMAQGSEQFSGISQFESVSTLATREQDGRATGTLLGLMINKEGKISGSFSNGETVDIAKVALAQFGNNGGLVNMGDGLFDSSISSGEADIFGLTNNSTMSIVSGSLEMSNVDLSKEFTEMITAQRGFQANSKIITTADQMIEELLRMKR